MIKAVIVKKNKVKKIIVAQNLAVVNLQPGESVHEYRSGLAVGDNFDGAWTRVLKALKLK
jgi:hypothetical protein